MRALLLALALAAGCAPRAMTVTGEHPANPDATIGRLAGPPPALRPGVAEPEAPTTEPKAAGHEHHEHASPADPEKHDPTRTDPEPAVDAKQPATSEKVEPPRKKPVEKQPATPKQPPVPQKPAEPKRPPPVDPHAGHH